MQLIEAERITVLTGAPTIYQTLLDHASRDKFDLSSLRFAVTGAAVVPVALVERMQSEMGFDLVLTAFGMTECVVGTMCRRGDPDEVVAGTCGRVVPGLEMRIAEPGGNDPPRPSTRTAGCTPETSARSTRRATSRSPTGSRTCSSSAASTSIRPRSNRCSHASTAWSSRPSSGCPTTGWARWARPTSYAGPA